jgi:hypothetical protein
MRRRFSPATFAVLCIAAAPPALAETPVATAIFKCQGGKSIDATFYASSVDLKLSDGRSHVGPGARATPTRTRPSCSGTRATPLCQKARTARRPTRAAPSPSSFAFDKSEEAPRRCAGPCHRQDKASSMTRSRHKNPLNEVHSTGGGAIEPPTFMPPCKAAVEVALA